MGWHEEHWLFTVLEQMVDHSLVVDALAVFVQLAKAQAEGFVGVFSWVEKTIRAFSPSFQDAPEMFENNDEVFCDSLANIFEM